MDVRWLFLNLNLMMTGTGPVEIIIWKNQSPDIYSLGKLIAIYHYYV